MIWNALFKREKYYYFIWLSLVFLSLLYSGTLLVVSMIMLLLPSFVSFRNEPLRIIFFPDFKKRITAFYRAKVYFVITLIFWISFFSVFNSADKESWYFFTMMKLPFLLLPFAFYFFPSFTKNELYGLLLVFVAIMFLSTFSVLYGIIHEPESKLELIRRGQSIQTPVDHIKYSLFISFAAIIGMIILLERETILFKGEKYILGVIFLYLFLFIHILAVRSGLAILYVNLIVLSCIKIIQQKNIMAGIFVVLLILGAPVAAYFTIPTFKEKVSYTVLDYRMHQQNKEGAFSDGERFRSYEIGWELFETSPISGIGIGDMFKEYKDLYEIKYFTKSPTNLPHNQFLTLAVGTGVIGLLFFLIAFFFPLLYKNAYQNPVLLTFHILMFLSFLVENTIERQYSVGFYLVFLLLGLNNIHKPAENVEM